MTLTEITLQHRTTKTVRTLAFDKDGRPVLVAPYKSLIRDWKPANWRQYERLPVEAHTLVAGAGGMG